MARLTIGREAIENSRRRLLVTRFALHRRVSAEQREAIQVIFDLLNSDVPSLNGMTLFAVLPQLMTVHIIVRMAVDAILTDIRNHGLHVALHALHFFVHATEGILGFVVIEFGDRANGTPSCGGMAVLAGNVQRRTVRTASCLFLGLPSLLWSALRKAGCRGMRGTAVGRKSKHSPESELEQSSRISLPTGRGGDRPENLIKSAASVNNLLGAYNCTGVQLRDSVPVLVTLLYHYTYRTSMRRNATWTQYLKSLATSMDQRALTLYVEGAFCIIFGLSPWQSTHLLGVFL